MTSRPKLRLHPKHGARLKSGSPWVYSNELTTDRAWKALAPGSLVDIVDDTGGEYGTAYFNPHSLIAARILSSRPGTTIGVDFFRERFDRARALRNKLFQTPYYRLVHAEGDNCPGLMVDRFDDILVVQSSTAGMDALEPVWLEALKQEFAPRSIIVKNNAPSRAHEGLKEDIRIAFGAQVTNATVEEHGVRHTIDPLFGQKTGWFYDQRDNRAFVNSLAAGASLLDVFSYTGAQALGALKAGAKTAIFLDASQAALDLAAVTARENDLLGRAEFRKCDAILELEEMVPTGDRFEIVSCDPPPFARSKKDIESAARGYRKLARLAAALVARGGFLILASCSHAIDVARFQSECAAGIARAGRGAKLIRSSGAAPDHPVQPMLPETAYLKSLVYQLD